MKVTRSPDLVTKYGQAWQIDTIATVLAAGRQPSEQACISQWIVSAPWAHPFWSCYWISIQHLRPFERDGKMYDDLLIYLEGATHEMWLYAVQPGADLDEQITTGRVEVLTPMNFASQMIYKNDAEAVQAVEQAVQDILQGQLNPDTDAISQWIARFGGNMIKGH